LDESFPKPILREALRKLTQPLEIEIAPLEEIDPSLFGRHDHDLIRELHARDAEGLITCDDAMVHRPEVLSAIEETRFSVVTCRRGSSDPFLATGLLFVHLREIAGAHRRDRDQIWRLGAAPVRPRSAAKQREELL
jgi:hypothetical protein